MRPPDRRSAPQAGCSQMSCFMPRNSTLTRRIGRLNTVWAIQATLPEYSDVDHGRPMLRGSPCAQLVVNDLQDLETKK